MTATAGTLIVFEGIDGTGKSTQLRLLARRLRQDGYEVVETCEPTDGPYGRKIRQLFARRASVTREAELELFLADRKEHVELVIAPALAQGRIVLCDRYFLSTAAYQADAGLDPNTIIAMNDFAPPPDLAVLIELDVTACLARITENRGEEPNDFEQLESLQKVDTIFRRMNLPYIYRIDGSMKADAIGTIIYERVAALLSHRSL